MSTSTKGWFRSLGKGSKKPASELLTVEIPTMTKVDDGLRSATEWPEMSLVHRLANLGLPEADVLRKRLEYHEKKKDRQRRSSVPPLPYGPHVDSPQAMKERAKRRLSLACQKGEEDEAALAEDDVKILTSQRDDEAARAAAMERDRADERRRRRLSFEAGLPIWEEASASSRSNSLPDSPVTPQDVLSCPEDPCGNCKQIHSKPRQSPTEKYAPALVPSSKQTQQVSHTRPPHGLYDAIVRGYIPAFPAIDMFHPNLKLPIKLDALERDDDPNLRRVLQDLLRMERRLNISVPRQADFEGRMKDTDWRAEEAWLKDKPLHRLAWNPRGGPNSSPIWCKRGDHHTQMDHFNSHFCYLLISPWPMMCKGDRYLWAFAARWIPRMTDVHLKCWLDTLQVNRLNALARVRMAIKMLTPAVQGIKSSFDATNLSQFLIGESEIDTEPMRRKTASMERRYLDFGLREIEQALNGMMQGLCPCPTTPNNENEGPKQRKSTIFRSKAT